MRVAPNLMYSSIYLVVRRVRVLTVVQTASNWRLDDTFRLWGMDRIGGLGPDRPAALLTFSKGLVVPLRDPWCPMQVAAH